MHSGHPTWGGPWWFGGLAGNGSYRIIQASRRGRRDGQKEVRDGSMPGERVDRSGEKMESIDHQMCLTKPKLFIVSGGPGSGKSTVLHELAGRGFRFAPEVARQIIQEQIQAAGTALPWVDRETYARLMLQRSIESYLEYTPALQPMFSDRGIPDTLCYARLIGLHDDGLIRDACRRYRYAPLVFLAPPWEEIYETDNERKQDFAEAERTFDQMVEVYRQCGYALSELPKTTPARRAEFILRQLHLDT
jgi:predicted ATPase